MAYIGNIPAEAYISISSQTFTTINGTGYTLSSSVTTSEDIALFLNNVRQKPSTYTAAALVLTMGTATTTADELYCVYLGKALQTVNPPAASVGTSSITDLAVTTAKLAGDAVTTAKVLDSNVTYAKIQDTTTANRVIGAATAGVVSEVQVVDDMTNFVSTSSAAGLTIKGDGTTDGYVALNCDQNTHAIKLKSPPHSAAQTYTLTFPITAPATDKYLQTTSGGQLSFATVSEYNDADIRNDLMTVALKQASQENMTKHNLPNSAVVVFQADADFNLAGSTDIARSSSKFIWAATEGYGAEELITGVSTPPLEVGMLANPLSVTAWIPAQLIDNDVSTMGFYVVGTSMSGYNKGFQYNIDGTTDLGSLFKLTKVQWYNKNTNARFKYFKIATSPDNVTYTDQTITAISPSTGTSTTILTASNADAWQGGELDTPAVHKYIRILYDDYYNNGNVNAGCNGFQIHGNLWKAIANATGTALGTTNVPSSAVTQVSGVFLMKNAYGTNTLGTDVKVYFTGDNSNWTEASSYTEAGTFSTGVTQITLGKTTVTSGSDVRWKIVFANQVADTKIAEIYGIGTNY